MNSLVSFIAICTFYHKPVTAHNFLLLRVHNSLLRLFEISAKKSRDVLVLCTQVSCTAAS